MLLSSFESGLPAAVITYNFLGISALAIASALLSWRLVEYLFYKVKRYFVLQRIPH